MSWHEANQKYLMRELAALRRALEGSAGASPPASDGNDPSVSDDDFEMEAPPALERLCHAFGLSRFERAIVLLCAGVELDAAFARIVAAAQSDSRQSFPTFGLAMAALPEPHWSALSPSAPLRRWRLIEVNGAESVTAGRIRLDERVLHYLVGVAHLDDRLAGLVDIVPSSGELPPSQQAHVDRIVKLWSSGTEAVLPLVQLCGDEGRSKHDVAAAACAALGLELYSIPAHALPAHPAELDAFIRLWQREAVLSGCGLLIDCQDGEAGDAVRQSAVGRLVEELRGVVLLSARGRRRVFRRPTLTVDVAKPNAGEQRALWRNFLGAAAANLNGKLDRLGAQFNFDASAIRAVCAGALHGESTPYELGDSLWESCRAQARPQLDELAQRITATASWDDLVLPESQKQMLREIAIHVRRRAQVYEEWGFATAGARGLGISALFAGPSGTGKTMAGEVLANELGLDLYRIDLSQVVSKYIGETEKNLRRVFDGADEGGAILLFDEADALFGKRSEVKDSHDRYANIEVSYLLQRMEAYRGLAILTTNLKSALDSAFLRRLRFIVRFPFPDTGQREEIWRRVFPAATPTDALDFGRLARLAVSGGDIRNIALSGAFLAAEADQPVRMSHLLQAARHECQKLERPLNESEIGGWR